MKVELSRFHVKPGKSQRVDEWLNMLNANMDEVLQTLEREEMMLEVIFREIIDGEEYLYWFSVQGESGEEVTTSPFEVDQKHMAFHEECTDHEYGRRDAQPQVIMAPAVVARAMGWSNAAGSVTAFQRREIIFRRIGSENA
jgi:Family of unknown function (DUF6176)